VRVAAARARGGGKGCCSEGGYDEGGGGEGGSGEIRGGGEGVSGGQGGRQRRWLW
jgi:hypothetical protein